MKKIKPDEYFCDGPFEVARFGNSVITRNNMTEEQNKKLIAGIVNEYEEQKNYIDNLINKIIDKLSKVDVLKLFNFITSMNFLISVSPTVTSEYESSPERNFQLRSVEYLQSLLIALGHDKKNEIDEEKQEILYHEILELCTKLYSEIPKFYMFWSAKQEMQGNLDKDDILYIIYAQLMSQVRGTQYQVFRIPILIKILTPFEELIKEIYGIPLTTIISGLEILEKNLSSGRLDVLNEFKAEMDKLVQFEDEVYPDDFIEKNQKIVEKLLGVGLFDVKNTTNWPDSLINDLCLNLGSDKSFMNHDEYPGWPIWNLPVQYKPFINIDSIVYCFDYYILFDNFYSSIQRAVRSHGKEYEARWNKIQGHSIEKIVGDIFEEILPGCRVHYSNFYPIGNKKSAENDILIEYKDVLIIVEVKAGNFVYTPAMMDYSAHKKSFSALVEKAEYQCIRIKDYINDESEKVRNFYTNDKLDEKAFFIDKEKFSQIYMFDVTVSDFNEFTSQMEKIKIAKAKEDIIVISLNDLWVYKNYFEDPLKFIHFIKHRTIATETLEIGTSDELDHLGMYIFHNDYSMQAKEMGLGKQVNFIGYRDELDKYFSSLNLDINYEKPIQQVPFALEKILDIAKEKTVIKTLFTNFLLDLSFENREVFANTIMKVADREKELGRMFPAACFGENCYVLFVEIPNIPIFPQDEREKYILANLATNKLDSCWSITICLDDKSEIKDIYYKVYCQSDILEKNRKELMKYGKEICQKRTEQFLVNNNKKKIYPNEPCICGSGKKYKFCCGKN